MTFFGWWDSQSHNILMLQNNVLESIYLLSETINLINKFSFSILSPSSSSSSSSFIFELKMKDQISKFMEVYKISKFVDQILSLVFGMLNICFSKYIS